MKYSDFHSRLVAQLDDLAYVGPVISMNLTDARFRTTGYRSKTSMESPIDRQKMASYRYTVFPVKLFGLGKIHHLNLVVHDRLTKTVERFEPAFTSRDNNLDMVEVSDALEAFLSNLMYEKKIYFLEYKTTYNTNTSNGKNCGLHCIKHAFERIMPRRGMMNAL